MCELETGSALDSLAAVAGALAEEAAEAAIKELRCEVEAPPPSVDVAEEECAPEFEFDTNEIVLDEDDDVDDDDDDDDVNAIDLRQEFAEDDDDEGFVAVPPRTSNEIVELPPPEPPEALVVDPRCELLQVGSIEARIDEQVVVKGLENGRAVVDGTVLCLANREPLGRVWEIFGPVRHPHYIVRTTLEAPIGEFIFAPQPMFVDANYVSTARGCDASNVHDEEVPEHLQEFSDDEAQTEAKRAQHPLKRPAPDGSSAATLDASYGVDSPIVPQQECQVDGDVLCGDTR